MLFLNFEEIIIAYGLMKVLPGALLAWAFILVSAAAHAQRLNFQELTAACNLSDTDCKSATSAFIGEGGLAGQRAIDIPRRLA